MSLERTALLAFCAVADHGSLTRAATILGESQSTLSRRLSALEVELRGRLFHRTGRGVVLTELGVRLHRRATDILNDMETLIREAHGEYASPSGKVVLGAVPGASRPLIADLCIALRKRYPRIHLLAVEGYSGEVEALLSSGGIDIGVLNRYGRAVVRGGDRLFDSVMTLVSLAPGGPVTKDMTFRGLHGVPLVLPPQPNSLVGRLRDVAGRQNVVLEVACEMSNTALIKDAVSRAGFATVVPRHVALRDFDGGAYSIRRIVKPVIQQSTWVVTSHRPVSNATRVVVKMVRQLAVRPLDLTVPD